MKFVAGDVAQQITFVKSMASLNIIFLCLILWISLILRRSLLAKYNHILQLKYYSINFIYEKWFHTHLSDNL